MRRYEGFSMSVVDRGAYVVVTTDGALNETAGVRVSEEIEQLLARGVRKLVFDLRLSLTFSSPTVAVFLELTERIADIKDGKVLFTGLTDLNHKIFEMVGVFFYAGFCPSLQEAEQQIVL